MTNNSPVQHGAMDFTDPPTENALWGRLHTIHGIGLADEWPSIPPQQDFERFGYDGVFAPGMTLCVESYTGSAGGVEGVKLEQMVLITPDGNRLLSTYPFEDSLL